MLLDNFVTIDFEASCLPRHGRSFPIEVAIAGPEGVSSWLIRPAAGHDGWLWSSEASALHGIDPAQIEREGAPAHQVFAQLNQAIAGRQVIADSRMDQYWWNVLAGAAGEDTDSRIIYIGDILDEIALPSSQIMTAQDEADVACPGRHRAADDARWLWTLIRRLHGLPEDNRNSLSLATSSPWQPSLSFAA